MRIYFPSKNRNWQYCVRGESIKRIYVDFRIYFENRYEYLLFRIYPYLLWGGSISMFVRIYPYLPVSMFHSKRIYPYLFPILLAFAWSPGSSQGGLLQCQAVHLSCPSGGGSLESPHQKCSYLCWRIYLFSCNLLSSKQETHLTNADSIEIHERMVCGEADKFMLIAKVVLKSV